MKVKFRACIISLSSAFLLLASSPALFAQKAKDALKYVPEAVAGKPQTVPHVINPNLPPAARRGIANLSGVAVERATAASTPKTGTNRSTLPATGQSQTTQLNPPSQRVLAPADFSHEHALMQADIPADIGTNLTGMQLLIYCYPAWRQELGGMFSNEQLDALERTFAATDDWIFVRNADGELQIRNPDEWNYETRFLTLLQESGVSFTEKQMKRLTGGHGISGFTLSWYFTIENLHGFIKAHDGHAPRINTQQNGKVLTVTELRKRAEQGDTQAATLIDEMTLGRKIHNAQQNWPKNSPEYKVLDALYNANRTRAVAKTPQQIIAAYKQWIANHPGTSPRETITENGKTLTLGELRKRAAQGDAQAAAWADELELGRSMSYALQNWPKDSPEYQELYALYEANRNTKTPQQIIAAYKQWIAKYPGTSPRNAIKENGKVLSLTELRKRAEQGDTQAALWADELELGIPLHQALQRWPKDSPEYQELYALYEANRNRAVAKTPQQVIAAYKQWIAKYPGTSPRTGIEENGKFLTLTELRKRAEQGDIQAAELADELELGRSIHNALRYWSKDSSEYQELYALYSKNKNRAVAKNSQQIIAAYKQWIAKYPGTSPRTGIKKNGKTISLTELRKRARQGDEEAAKLADEFELGRAVETARYSWDKNSPEYKELDALYNENRNKVECKTTNELYQDLVAHIRDYGYYPIWKENSLPGLIYNRLRRYQSTMVDGKYTDPWLQKIYELKQWSERVKRGEVDWEQFPGLLKKHRKTIGEMRREGQQPSPETAKEFETLSAEEQQAIEEMADNMLTLWENFESEWWQENQKHVITTPQTQTAFNTVLATVRNQVPGAHNVNISNVLEQVNGMQLGNDGPGYYRVIYRGDNPRIPRAEDFHNVQEIPGLPQRFAEPAYQLNSAHIDLNGGEETVLNMVLRSGVTDREMNALIHAMTPAGWEVRIGAHELLSDIKKGKMHIHIEQVVPTTEEGAVDISYKLTVDARELTRGKNPQQVAKTLRYLFSSYLTEEGQRALNNIQKAF